MAVAAILPGRNRDTVSRNIFFLPLMFNYGVRKKNVFFKNKFRDGVNVIVHTPTPLYRQ